MRMFTTAIVLGVFSTLGPACSVEVQAPRQVEGQGRSGGSCVGYTGRSSRASSYAWTCDPRRAELDPSGLGLTASADTVHAEVPKGTKEILLEMVRKELGSKVVSQCADDVELAQICTEICESSGSKWSDDPGVCMETFDATLVGAIETDSEPCEDDTPRFGAWVQVEGDCQCDCQVWE